MISEPSISADQFKQSMRLLAGGVCILATSHNGERHGLTMTAVCSLTIDPPSLIACVNRGAGTRGIISATRRVSVNILADDHAGLAERFGSPAVRGSDRFDASAWTELPSGVPALADALAVLDCEVMSETELGQHCVFFCEVKHAVLQPDKKPLVHFNREFCVVQPV
ncbi:flavin reductase family protein [Rhodopseudomonas sp. B29]|uniref:flavin reductase family protein n=1 Tax=Rhodopseudomonas sp. B29 TaxID=95607 RepID=UPI000347F2BB|nr:flavin reductase family protein [Rhodopseudomonas sp. B29]